MKAFLGVGSCDIAEDAEPIGFSGQVAPGRGQTPRKSEDHIVEIRKFALL